MRRNSPVVTADDLPAEPGAYLLVIELDEPLDLKIAALGEHRLAPGRYGYCGSARGPGGLRARVGRHLRRGKVVRWHVDRLTAAGHVVDVRAEPGGNECDLFARLTAVPGTRLPVPGFGSSDCRRCPAHLAALPAGFTFAALV